MSRNNFRNVNEQSQNQNTNASNPPPPPPPPPPPGPPMRYVYENGVGKAVIIKKKD